MVVPNHTCLKLKMPGLKLVIIIKGSFEQAYYYEQDYITQAATLDALCVPDGSGHDVGRALAKETTKAAVVLDRPGIGKAAKAPGSSNSLARPPSRCSPPLEGFDPINVSFDLSPLGKANAESSA